MPKNQFNIFEDDPRKIMDGLRKQYEKGFSADMDRAAEILQQEYLKFLKEATVSGFTGVLANAQVIVKYKRKYKNIPRVIKVYIPDGDTSDGDEGGDEDKAVKAANISFNVLNSGRGALGDAHAHGLKVWPMKFPRSLKAGNSPMTRPGSPDLSIAYSHEETVFRRFINKPIKPRFFVREIMARTQKRLDDEGLSYITLAVTEQD